jgi:hypothetical protein
MITYLYWLVIGGIAVLLTYIFAAKMHSWRTAMALATATLLIGWAAYLFYFKQVFV